MSDAGRTHRVNAKSIGRALVRTLIVLLALLAAALVVASFHAPQVVGWAFRTFSPPPAPTPPPPTLLAARGAMPAGPVALQEWTRYRGRGYGLAGSGFLMRLNNGLVVGLTTAHSLASLGAPGHTLERVAFSLPGQAEMLVEFDTLHGPPGRPRAGSDLAPDYVLLKVDAPVDPALVLTPDPRGLPQPGERVSLFSGLGDGRGGRRELAGTVQSADPTGVWVLMDETFDAGLMSGSPLVSQHTGLVVGMAIAVAPRRDRILIGFHPVGHIVEIAEAAAEFPKIAEYRR